METMKAALYSGVEQIAIHDVERQPPPPGYLVLAMRQDGVCGSDLHAYFGHWPQSPGQAQGSAGTNGTSHTDPRRCGVCRSGRGDGDFPDVANPRIWNGRRGSHRFEQPGWFYDEQAGRRALD